MSAAYDRVRKALEGTPLAGDLDRLNAELHLTPDAAEWSIAALTAIGTAALARDLQAVERGLVRLPDTLDSSMRSAGVEIVRGLAQDIAGETSAAIQEGALAKFIEVASKLEEAAFTTIGEIRTAAEDTTAVAQAEIAATSGAMTQVSSSLASAAMKIGGWTSQRIVTAGIAFALGVAGSAAMFVAGSLVHADDVVTGCSGRVAHVTGLLRLDAHRSNAIRNYICKG